MKNIRIIESVLLTYASKIINLVNICIFYWLAKQIADFYFYFVKRGKKELINNLRFLPPQEIKRTARRTFHNFAMNLVDFYRIPSLNKNIDKLVEVKGLHYLDDALKQGKGVIGVTSHLGNWELPNVVLALKGYKLNTIYADFGNEELSRLFRKLRSYGGTKLIPINMQLKKAIEILKNNEILGIAIDRFFFKKGITVNFLNRKVEFPKGMARFAQYYNSPMVIGFCLRKQSKYELILEKPIDFENTGDKEKDLVINTQKVVSIFEKYVLQYPDQWYMFHKIKEI